MFNFKYDFHDFPEMDLHQVLVKMKDKSHRRQEENGGEGEAVANLKSFNPVASLLRDLPTG